MERTARSGDARLIERFRPRVAPAGARVPPDLEHMHGSIPLFAVSSGDVQIDNAQRVGVAVENLANGHSKFAQPNRCMGGHRVVQHCHSLAHSTVARIERLRNAGMPVPGLHNSNPGYEALGRSRPNRKAFP